MKYRWKYFHHSFLVSGGRTSWVSLALSWACMVCIWIPDHRDLAWLHCWWRWGLVPSPPRRNDGPCLQRRDEGQVRWCAQMCVVNTKALCTLLGFPSGSGGKESACDMGDLGSIPELGRSPGEGNGNPLQNTCLETPWTEEPGGLWSTGSQRVGHSWATFTRTF